MQDNHRLENALVIVILCGLCAGGIAWARSLPSLATQIWFASTLIALVPSSYQIVRDLWKKQLGVDVIALLAMAGALWLGENLAGAVVALMLTGGQALERFAQGRAQRELRALLERQPTFAHCFRNNAFIDVAILEVKVGDRILVKSGEVVPVDGVLLSAAASLDTSALTGESLPIDRVESDQIQSGVVNAGGAFEIHAIATAEHSTYAGIVRLVDQARASKAPLVRLADRYALWFVPFTIAVAGLTWFFTHDATRLLAVLVVATPCPLILAAPVAIVAGISRAANRGIIVKGGGALETLARAEILLLDKTGTLTTGIPTLSHLESFSDYSEDDILRLAASLDQMSHHVLAAAIVQAARDKHLTLSFPTQLDETQGVGIKGMIDGKEVSLGKSDWIGKNIEMPARALALRRRSVVHGASTVFIGVDGKLAGVLLFEDPIRLETSRTVRQLKRMGIRQVIMVTGDHRDVANVIGSAIGADAVYAECTPERKIEVTREMKARGVTMMVGDGINDAPALAAADVGIALGARGATASSEAADVVLLVDQFDRLMDAVSIARRSRTIALQSIGVGMGLSGLAMLFAAGGFLVPVVGALVQEAIDVLVILNALRALGKRRKIKVASRDASDASRHLEHEHQRLLPEVRRLRVLGDRLDEMPFEKAKSELVSIKDWLVNELLPHEDHEDNAIYPLIAKIIGGNDPTATMSREHLEIAHLTKQFSELVETLHDEMTPEDLRDFRRLLYGLYALLNLHFAQEDEQFLAMLHEQSRVPGASIRAVK